MFVVYDVVDVEVVCVVVEVVFDIYCVIDNVVCVVFFEWIGDEIVVIGDVLIVIVMCESGLFCVCFEGECGCIVG